MKDRWNLAYEVNLNKLCHISTNKKFRYISVTVNIKLLIFEY